ncbi:MAG: nuclear transport factor 2 family protein [Sphingomonadales bacterium]|nr:nuclear transport factor 2 family protein [Sphingomonadales bacterium]
MSDPALTDLALTDLERLVELEAIRHLKARRDHAVDLKDWDTYAALHTDDYTAMSITADPIVGGKAAAAQLAVQLAGVTTVHHCHTSVITFQDRAHATGVWAMEDNLFWTRNGEKQWLRGFGFYHEAYVKGADGEWRFSYRRLQRTHAETSPGASAIAFDISGENMMVGI